MKRVKIGLIAVLIALTIFMCSCSSIRGFQLTSLTSKESVIIQEQSTEIIRCLTNNDREGFISLFCEHVRENDSFEQEVDDVFSFFECDTYIKSEINNTASGGESIDKGLRTEWYVVPEITYIKVVIVPNGNYDLIADRYYGVSYYLKITDTNNPKLEGLHSLTINLLNTDHTVQIGTDE